MVKYLCIRLLRVEDGYYENKKPIVSVIVK